MLHVAIGVSSDKERAQMTFQLPQFVNGIRLELGPIEPKLRWLGDKAAAPLELVARAANRATPIKIETEDSGLRGIEAGFGYRLTWDFDGVAFTATDLEWGFDPEISTFTFCLVQYGGPLTICIFAPEQLRRTTMGVEELVVLFGAGSADLVGAGPTAACLQGPHAVLSETSGQGVRNVRNACSDSTQPMSWMLERLRSLFDVISVRSERRHVVGKNEIGVSKELDDRSNNHSAHAVIDFRWDNDMSYHFVSKGYQAMRAILIHIFETTGFRRLFTQSLPRVNSAAANLHTIRGATTVALGAIFHRDGPRRRGVRILRAGPDHLRQHDPAGDFVIKRAPMVGVIDLRGIFDPVARRWGTVRLVT